MTAPEKIWVEDHGSGAWYDGSAEVLLSEPDHGGVPFYQYTRSDLCTPAPAVAELVEALREAAQRLSWFGDKVGCESARAAIAAWEGK